MSRVVFAALAVASMLYSQSTPRPGFEVASVKSSAANCGGPGPNSGPIPGRLELPCMNARILIRVAYGTLLADGIATRSIPVLGGPAWLDTDKFDISAKAEGRASATQMMGPMLQALLEERFQLKLHVEPRESPVYALTVAKGGPKLKLAKDGNCVPLDLNNRELWTGVGPTPCGMPKMTGSSGVMTVDVAGTTMEEFAGRVLPNQAGRAVVDRTGLTARYDLHLEFSRDLPGAPVRLNGIEQPAPPPADNAGPSIFTALQAQLGLKLSPDRAPLNVIVIDSIQKPAEN